VRAAPKQKMVADWEGLTVGGGGDSDGGGRKGTGESRGGSVAGVDERRVAWPCAEESEGEKRRGEHDGVRRLFEAEAARQRRGVRGWSPRGGWERGREGGPGVAWDSAAARHRPTAAQSRCEWATRRGTSRDRLNRGGAEGLTDGPRPQCREVALADRRARAAQCVRFNSV
jgi:hypothetical protein